MKKLPYFIFMTDCNRVAEPHLLISHLPKNSMVIIRDYDIKNRSIYASKLAEECIKNKILFLVAGDYNLARKLKANGMHLPEYCSYHSYLIRKKQPNWIITTATHSEMSVSKVLKYPIDAITLSPIFPTKSHIGGSSMGLHNFRKICNKYQNNIYALGGINSKNISRLRNCKISGIAGIGLFTKNIPFKIRSIAINHCT